MAYALTSFMTDLTVSITDIGQKISGRSVVETASALYAFGIDSSEDLFYRKSTDGGKRWGSKVVIKAATYARACVWFDQWTPGDAGTVIHIWAVDDAADNVDYFSLDTASDTLGNGGTEVVVFDGASTDSSDADMTGAKSRGGTLYCVFQLDSATEKGCYWSTDDGATWSSRADPVEATGDYFLLFPGGEADADDMWLAYWDVSANEISLKTYDASGNSWSEASISGSMAEATWSNVNTQWAGFIDPDNNHLMFAAWTARNSASGELKTWDINGAASITARASIAASTQFGQSVLLTRFSTGTIRAYYLYSPAGSFTTLELYYRDSGDDMASWSAAGALVGDQPRDYVGISGALASPSDASSGVQLIERIATSDFYLLVTYEIPDGVGGGGVVNLINGGLVQ